MKMSNNFELIQVSELPSVFNRDIVVDKELLKSCRMEYMVVFQFKKNFDSTALHVNIRYVTSDSKVLMQEGASFIVKIEGWREISHDVITLRSNNNIQSLVDYGLSFVSGMIFHRASGTVMNTVFMPHISAQNIMQNVSFDEVEK